MQKIVGKKYYRILFKLISPLAVGSGETIMTDKDITIDSQGKPYIPGSALAGVYRRMVVPEKAAAYFGNKLSVGREKVNGDEIDDGEALTESKIVVYDAHIYEGEPYTTKRDMVALDDYKTAKPGAKFDFEVLEPGVTFITYIEQNKEARGTQDEEDIVDAILREWQTKAIAVGAKTQRGYGYIEVESIKTASFDMERDVERWLEFDMYNSGDHCWEDWVSPGKSLDILPVKKKLCISLRLKQQGGISIRQYSTKKDGPDYMQMKRHDETPVIPGTSWAGAFRAQMKRLGLSETELTECFGTAKEEAGHRSCIAFAESNLRNGRNVLYSRNAIDRFTGGTVDGALYSEITYYNGDTELEITIEDIENIKEQTREKIKKVLAAAMMDLHNGYMAVGGLTAIGRGLFQIESACINGCVISGDKITYQRMVGAMEEAC